MTLSLPNKRQQFRQLDRQTPHLERISIWSAIAGTGLAAISQQILYACVPLSFYVALLNRDRHRLQRACQTLQTQTHSIVRLQATDVALEERLEAMESAIAQPDRLIPIKVKV